MTNNDKQTGEVPTVQVFEITMDNAEDQDELNRRLTKPEEPAGSRSGKVANTAQGESPPDSNGKRA
jgi:hypothetical protein